MTDEPKLIIMRSPGLYRDGLNTLISVVKENIGQELTMVEIGSYAGESAEIWAQSGVFKKIVCVDAWKNGWNDEAAASNTTEIAEKKFDEVAAMYPCIEKFKSDSSAAAKEFEDCSLDLVYIDANHAYDAVKSDIETWLPKVKKGGIIAGHDYGNRWDGVMLAVNDKFGKPNRIFEDTSWLVFV